MMRGTLNVCMRGTLNVCTRGTLNCDNVPLACHGALTSSLTCVHKYTHLLEQLQSHPLWDGVIECADCQMPFIHLLVTTTS